MRTKTKFLTLLIFLSVVFTAGCSETVPQWARGIFFSGDSKFEITKNKMIATFDNDGARHQVLYTLSNVNNGILRFDVDDKELLFSLGADHWYSLLVRRQSTSEGTIEISLADFIEDDWFPLFSDPGLARSYYSSIQTDNQARNAIMNDIMQMGVQAQAWYRMPEAMGGPARTAAGPISFTAGDMPRIISYINADWSTLDGNFNPNGEYIFAFVNATTITIRCISAQNKNIDLTGTIFLTGGDTQNNYGINVAPTAP